MTGEFFHLLATRLLGASVQSLLLVAVLWWACRTWTGLPASVRCLLWWLASLQLVLGLIWPNPLELALLPSSLAEPAAIAAPASLPAAPLFALPELHAASVQAAPLPLAAPAGTDGLRSAPWVALLAWLWLCGVAMTLVQSAAAYRQARRWRRHAWPCTRADVLALYRAVGSRMDLRRLPPLRISDRIHSPQLLGPLRPCVLLPVQALEHFSDEDLHMALRHELTHLRRRDLWWGWLPALARHLFFFHPAAHLIEREYAFAREAACDEAVLADDCHSPQAYGRLLLRLGVAPRPCAGMAGASPTHALLKRRLVMLQNSGARARLFPVVLMAAVVAAGVLPYRVIAHGRPAPAASAAPAPASASAARPAAQAVVAAAPVPAARPAASPRPGVAVATQRPAPAAQPAAATAATRVSSTSLVATAGQAPNDFNYVLMEGEHVTASAETDDFDRARRARGGNDAPMLWVRRQDAAYVIRDPATVKRAQDIWAATNALGEQQGKLGTQQGELGRRQGELGSRQGAIGAQMGELGRKHAEIALRHASLALADDASADRQRASLDRESSELDSRQADFDRQQQGLAEQQEVLARQQSVLAGKQAELARRQQVESDRAHAAMQVLINEAIRQGIAQPSGNG